MPYEWITPPDGPSPPLAELHLWPYRSLPKTGFVWFVGVTVGLISIPLIALIGTVVLWGLLPFLVLVIWAQWAALQRSYRDGELLEELVIWPEKIILTRHSPRKPIQTWQANPYWVHLTRHETGGPVEDYLTLKGNGRTVEIGAFLSPPERRQLYGELQLALRRTK